MNIRKIPLILAVLIFNSACTDDDEPHRTYWKKDISNLFEIHNGHLYSIDNNNFNIYPLDDSEMLQRTGKITRSDGLTSMHINGDRAILTDEEQNNFVVDIIDPTNPSYATLKNYALYDNFTIQNNHLFHSSYRRSEQAIFSIDLDTIASPMVKQIFATKSVLSMANTENTLYFCESSPVYEEVTVDTPEGIEIKERISHFNHELKALDITYPEAMSILEMDNELNCDNISISGNLLFDKNSRQLKQYDITEFPPTLMSELSI